MPKNKNICKDLSFDDCELAILRMAVDKAEEKMGRRVVNSDDIREIIKIVEDFIRRKNLICYGGTAINNILPSEDQFYNKDVEIPDYDFFTTNALKDAKELADIYYKEGFEDVEAKSGQHHGTYKVFVNYIPVADIVYGVNKVFPIYAGSSTSKNIFDLQYQLRLNDLYDLTSTSVVYYTTVMNHLQLLDTILNGQPMFRFNRLTNRLNIDIKWGTAVKAGDYIIYDGYKAIDPASFTKMYNEPWLKSYTTALFKAQW